MEPAESEAAWADVVLRWDDVAAHHAFLDRCRDLEGLADAGRRYKAALDARPDDVAARRGRDEVVRRAMALAFASLPRTKPPRSHSRGVRAVVVVAFVAVSVAAAVFVATSLASVGAAR
ncbi:MAG: hypothetical protein ACJ79E_10045 [Anaeromyxobacteraceae bacterium]